MAGLFGAFGPGTPGGLLGMLTGAAQPQQPDAQQAPQQPMIMPSASPLGAPADPSAGDRISAFLHNMGGTGGGIPGIFDAFQGLATGQRMDPRGVQMQMMAKALQSLPADMPFAQKLAILQNPDVQKSLYGISNVGTMKTPGGYEIPAVTNGQGGASYLTPGQGPQGPLGLPGATAKTIKPGEQVIDFGAGGGAAQPGTTLQNTTGMFDPSTVDYYANYVRKSGDQSVFQNLGRSATGALNVAAVRQRIAQLDAQEGVTPQQTASKTAEFAGYKAGQETAGRRLANVSLAINEAQQLIPQALEASQKVPLQSQYKTVNAITQAYLEHTGDPNVVQLGAALYGLVHAYARAVNPQGISAEGDMKHATDILDQALARNQLGAGIAQIYKEMKALQQSPGAVKDEMRGEFTGQKSGAPSASDALLQARLAISQGAPRDKVIQRLKERGIDAGGL